MTDKLKPVRPRIVIDETEGPGGSPLKQCFFMSTDLEGAYNIYDSKARLLAAYVVSGEDFNLTVDGTHFFISKFIIDDRAASGSWSIGHHNHPREAKDLEQEGSFQASSSGGFEPDAINEAETEAAPVAPVGAIEIKTVTGGADKDKLKGCYFMYGGTTWSLYNKSGNLLQSGQTSATSFSFNHDSSQPGGTKIPWTVTNFTISATAASGNWSNPDDASITDAQEGTFQASSSGGVEPEVMTATAPSAPAGSLEIKTVTGGADKDKLKGCYFVVSGTTWSLYNKNGVLLQSGQTSSTGFTFEHDSNQPGGTKITWTVTNFAISTTAASGNWSNPDSITGDQDGTFQASSSGGMGEGQVAAGASA